MEQNMYMRVKDLSQYVRRICRQGNYRACSTDTMTLIVARICIYVYLNKVDRYPNSDMYIYKHLQISCGLAHALVVTAAGNVYSMGANAQGQLGLGDVDKVCPTPFPATAFTADPQ
jgi:alpha-tubulin suppressor-like RCC1 family protein